MQNFSPKTSWFPPVLPVGSIPTSGSHLYTGTSFDLQKFSVSLSSATTRYLDMPTFWMLPNQVSNISSTFELANATMSSFSTATLLSILANLGFTDSSGVIVGLVLRALTVPKGLALFYSCNARN